MNVIETQDIRWHYINVFRNSLFKIEHSEIICKYTFMPLAGAFTIENITFLTACLFAWYQPHKLCAANVMLYKFSKSISSCKQK